MTSMSGFLSCPVRRRPSSTRSRRRPWPAWLGAAALAVVCLGTAATAREPPELRFEAPATLAPQVERLETLDPASLAAIMDLLGLRQPGPPIRVQLVTEGSPEARRAPSWAVAYAVGGAGLVVLIPSRVPGYPDKTLDTVLRHEVAHVLIARAARHHAVPRWFNEGLAIHAARDRSFEDQARLTFATLRRGSLALSGLDRRFQGGPRTAASAYALATAFVRFLLDRHGRFAAAEIFDQMAQGHAFHQAFRRALGSSLEAEEARFWRHLDIWSKWVPLLSSSTTLWLLITLLALWAFKRRRERDAEQLAAWDDEERRRLQGVLEHTSTDGWVN